MKTLLSVAKSALHENLTPADAERLHAAAVEAVRRRRRFRLRMRILRFSTAACLLVSVGLALRPRGEAKSGMTPSTTESALEILLYDEYGVFFDDDAGDASEKLLLFQEYPGNL